MYFNVIAITVAGSLVISSVIAAPIDLARTSDLSTQSKRQLAELLGPALAALEPLAQGIDQGVTAGASNVNAAVRDAGEAVNQAASGIAQGAGETVAETPGAVDRTVHNLANSGLAGDAVNTVFGAPSS